MAFRLMIGYFSSFSFTRYIYIYFIRFLYIRSIGVITLTYRQMHQADVVVAEHVLSHFFYWRFELFSVLDFRSLFSTFIQLLASTSRYSLFNVNCFSQIGN